MAAILCPAAPAVHGLARAAAGADPAPRAAALVRAYDGMLGAGPRGRAPIAAAAEVSMTEPNPQPPPPAARRRRRARAVMAVATTLVLLGGAELLIRALHLAPPPDTFNFLVRSQDNDVDMGFVRLDPQLMWSLRPGTHIARCEDGGLEPCDPCYKRYGIDISSQGFRDREYPREKPAGAFRILSLGDSTTFGFKVAPAQLYHSLVEAALNRREGPGGRTYEVINGGVPGYSSTQGLLFFQLRGVALRPDLVTIHFGPNDSRPGGWKSDQQVLSLFSSRRWTVLRPLLLDLGIYRILREQYRLLAARGTGGAPREPRVPPAVSLRNVMAFKATCDRLGIPLIHLESPAYDKVTLYRRTHPEAGVGFPRIPRVVVPRHAAGDPSRSYLCDDTVHLNGAGHQEMARRLMQLLDAKRLLPGRGAAPAGPAAGP